MCLATGPKQVASDGPRGRNGPFTEALLRHFGTPGCSISEIMQWVRRDVKDATNGKQVPWEHSSLMTTWYPAGR